MIPILLEKGFLKEKAGAKERVLERKRLNSIKKDYVLIAINQDIKLRNVRLSRNPLAETSPIQNKSTRPADIKKLLFFKLVLSNRNMSIELLAKASIVVYPQQLIHRLKKNTNMNLYLKNHFWIIYLQPLKKYFLLLILNYRLL